MAFLGPNELRDLLPNCIDRESYNENRIKQAAYELSLGDETFRTDAKKGKPEILDDKNTTVEINPGQFALLLTKEEVIIPSYILAFISIKAGEKLKGLLNVSGFHVDPGFKGKLLFSVYNAGPSTITLKRGERYFLMWFCKLQTPLKEEDLYNDRDNNHQGQSSIATKYIDALKRGELASPNVLLDKVKSNDQKLEKVFWALGILIALCIAVGVKVYTDSSKIKSAYEAGLKERAAKEEIQNAVTKSFADSLVLKKVDTILSSKKIIIDSNGNYRYIK